MKEDFNNFSYKRHQHSYTGKESHSFEDYRDWFSKNTTDVWRHKRKLEFIEPLISGNPGDSWLCIGDGRFGTSSMFIDKRGGVATATDLDTSLLQLAVDNGLISRMAYQNAEALSYDNSSFDFVMCKEAFHHFPRPFVGFYEMLRVSRKAVILIEPLDRLPMPFTQKFVQGLKDMLKKSIGKQVVDVEQFNYEVVGNYVYSISEREFEKAALALDLPLVAYLRFDDVYIPGSETEDLNGPAPLFRQIKNELEKLKWKRRLGLANANYSVTIVFKEVQQKPVLDRLEKIGFRLRRLPRNPYMDH